MSPAVTVNDEREGLPSASIYNRLIRCLGSWRATRGLEELTTDKMARYAETGDRVHLYLEMPEFVDLSEWPEEQEIAEQCESIRDRLLEKYLGTSDQSKLVILKEIRFWYYGPSKPPLRDRVKKASARCDFIAINTSARIAAVIDYKSGRGEQPEPSSNAQLRMQALLAWLDPDTPEFDTCYTAVVQPLVSKESIPCLYDATSLREAEQELITVLDEIEKPDAPIEAGEHCTFCPARMICPEARKSIDELSAMTALKASKLTPEQFGKLLTQCRLASNIIDIIQSTAKAKLNDDPKSIPGWELKENSPVREVKDPESVYEILYHHHAITNAEFLRCTSVSVGALEKAIKSAEERRGNKCSLLKAKALFNKNLGHMITKKPKGSSLVPTTK